MRHIVWMIALGAASLLVGTDSRAADKRYAAMLVDGTRIEDDQVANWHDPNSQPVLNNRAIFDANNPFRWLIDRTLPPAPTPEAFVEFAGGDRLPGRVIGFREGGESPYDQFPPHLIVEPSVDLNWPDFGPETPVRIRANRARRIVWQLRPNSRYRPSTVFLRDGREIGFRSFRWADKSVMLLLDDGIRTIVFNDIAEVHLPRHDPWHTYYEQVAALTPSGSARLFQLETTDGLIATTSTERFQPKHRGDPNRPESLYQQIQPAWSLDPFWVRFATVHTWRFFAPHEVPLTRIEPVQVRQESVFGSGLRWRLNQNVHGQPLRSGGAEFAWGFGVHAQNEMQFELPPIARSLQTRFGLDQLVGEGGCVRVSMFAGSNRETQLFQSDLLIGSDTVTDTGPLSLPQSGASQLVTLVVDAAHAERPEGADPFDIRDSLDWLEPLVVLDADGLAEEIRQRLFSQLPALTGWSLDEADMPDVVVENHWNQIEPQVPNYRPLLATTAPFVRYSRSMRVDLEDQWLALMVSRENESAPTRLQVSIDGRAMAEFEVPVRTSLSPPNPLFVPISAWRGRRMTVEIAQISAGEHARVDWRGVALLKKRPLLQRLFEDEAGFVRALRDGEGEVELVQEESYTGKTHLRVSDPGRGAARIERFDFPIREHPQVGEYRYLRFAWRKSDGAKLGLGVGHDGELGDEMERRPGGGRDRTSVLPSLNPRRRLRTDDRGRKYGFRYDAGRGEPVAGASIRLQANLPEQWTVLTRDLYADFGQFNLTGLEFLCGDGEFAEFDHIYLARSQQDFEGIADSLPSPLADVNPEPSDANVVRETSRPEEYGEILASLAPQFTTAMVGDGLRLMSEHAGRRNVVRTYPPAQGQPCVLRSAVHVPEGKRTRLEMRVGHQEEGDWQLIVKVGDETLHDSVIGEQTAPEGWADVQVDLSRFAGRKIVLEVHNHPNNWPHEAAYWSRLAVVSE